MSTSPASTAAVGNPDPLEFSDVRATDQKLKPLVEASGGSSMWLADNADPDIRSVRPGRAAGGSDWIGLRRNEDYTAAGINQLSPLAGILVAVAFLMAIVVRGGVRGGELIRSEPVFTASFPFVRGSAMALSSLCSIFVLE
jgi:hypothetical protein